MGKLLVLEILLRMALMAREKNTIHQNRKKINTYNIGDIVDLNNFTNSDQMGKLIKQYNQKYSESEIEKIINPKPLIDDIRDLIAHARIVVFSEDSPFELFKFLKSGGKEYSSLKEENKTKLTHRQKLTEDWFKESDSLIDKEIKKVTAAINEEKNPKFSAVEIIVS